MRNSKETIEAKNDDAKRTANATALNGKLNNKNTKEENAFVNEVIEKVTTPSAGEVAEEVNTNTVETTATVEPVAEVNTTAEVEAVTTVTVTAEETTIKTETPEAVSTVVINPPTLEELKDKGKTLYILAEKYDEVKAKADHLRNFKLTHQKDVAKIVLSDADGQTFSSSNPKAIAKFIDFCGEQFENTLSELETEIRKVS